MLKQVENVIAWGKERVANQLPGKEKATLRPVEYAPDDALELEGVEQRLATVRFRVDSKPHIQVNNEICKECSTQACVYVCPANLFNIVNGEMLFVYDNCFECGTCYVACGNQAIHWSYPQGGYGVSFRQA